MTKFQQRLLALKTIGAPESLVSLASDNEDAFTAIASPAIWWNDPSEIDGIDLPADGSLSFEWQVGHKSVWMDLHSDGDVLFFVSDEVTGTKPVRETTLSDALSLINWELDSQP